MKLTGDPFFSFLVFSNNRSFVGFVRSNVQAKIWTDFGRSYAVFDHYFTDVDWSDRIPLSASRGSAICIQEPNIHPQTSDRGTHLQ
jgi:hypothetical protein